ncbi:hypothetical protein [Streptomyces pinistramenti]|uniref:hypothetical protein n=1 Tax=Streptomyces pinistramenti TaxID=2884812 RepID=UPI001D0712EF|nr:hypothetical protein [Streptomyces pinistramenti]MCB5908118.1 hypothetical protein [Streptomyces pinistramenti]
MSNTPPWWYRIPATPLGIIICTVATVAFIALGRDIEQLPVAVGIGLIVGLLTAFGRGMAQARWDERNR